MKVRRVRPDDERALHSLVLYAQRRVLLEEWDEIRALLRDPPHGNIPGAPAHSPIEYDLLCGETEGRVGCFWASVTGAGGFAHLVALIVHDAWPLQATTAVLLSEVKRALRCDGLGHIAYVGVEPWLAGALAENGFARSGSVITLQKSDRAVPDRGNTSVHVRPAERSDLAAILAVDERSFVPLWRTNAQTLADQLSRSPCFYVGELQQQVIGYAYASLFGRHAHLTRLVVDPSVQGQRIGVRLLAECVDFFQRAGVYGITLNTQRDNQRARRLYQWFGFVLLGQEAEVWLCAL